MSRSQIALLAICWLVPAACTEKATKQAPLTDEQLSVVMAELALPRRTLNEKMAKYGLSRGDYL